jgi:plasmid segregation protein ParM
MYQPMGTFWSVCYGSDGNLVPGAASLLKSNLMVLDGGFGTLDRFMIKAKQLSGASTDDTLGMKRILEETRALVQKETGASVSLPAMQECLRKGKVQVIDRATLSVRSVPVESYLARANEMVCAEAFESVKDHVFDIRYLIMTGGTGAAWMDYFRERLKGVTTLEILPGNRPYGIAEAGLPAVYANARGYYMYRYNALKRAGKAGVCR